MRGSLDNDGPADPAAHEHLSLGIPRHHSESDVFTSRSATATASSSSRDPSFGVVPATARKSRKGPTTRTACTKCRKSKVKCDGKHPACSRCVEHNERCSYDVPEEGMTRMQFMNIQLQRKTRECRAMLGILEYLRSQPEAEATELLATLRSGEQSLIGLIERFMPVTSEQTDADESSWSAHLPRSSVDLGESAVSPDMLDPGLPHPYMMQGQHDPSTYAQNGMRMGMLPADPEEAARMMEEVERLRYGRQGMPQVSFNGIEWH